nr:MAG TPA: hypothetical protein [Bacteriophage sp.]DAU65834.1 MAG TPA: hypothetical protein [Caudoviricetes sp.]DAY70486.1 MAG TPA: hypothetical protein [Caudoviricetes sp.]DAZ54814.1 MAG TPA: hypothetical protein [Caudoviricetes sp.]
MSGGIISLTFRSMLLFFWYICTDWQRQKYNKKINYHV